jgi:septal ring factor EnvC (AmiA/AmiB activator)
VSTRATTHLAAAGLAAFLAWNYQGARLGADLAEARAAAVGEKLAVSTAQRAADARLRQAEQSINTKNQEALNAAIKKQNSLQADAARAGRERDSLRRQLSNAERRLADASPSALIEYSNTLNQLLGQCSERYTELAKRADGHAVDAETCRAAWPVIAAPIL